ncbi:MAG TPA: penicillin-insensitive murein endopeptidase [Polyangiaceae bacterium]|nr:penicillin-insensitive murein endopeptidase [Polyangiaceae bacterium]
MATRWVVRAALASALVVAAMGRANADDPRELPKKYSRPPYSLMSLTVGYPNEGYQIRAKRLMSSRALKVRPTSRERAYGHPALVLMLHRSAEDVAKAAPGSVLFVGDIAAKKGGPISGHRSHQSGRDADLGFYMKNLDGKPVPTTELVAFDGDGKAKDGRPLLFDDERNWFLVESWVRDRRAGLSHIFVSWPLRARLLQYGEREPKFRPYVTAAAALLKQPENGEPHDDHFHVRISCPKDEMDICRNESKL